MTTESELIALAERVEAATEPDRELRDDIMLALGWTYRIPGGLKFHYWFDPSGKRIDPPDPLRSLDGAMTLIGEESFWRVGHDGEGPDPSLFSARVFDPIAMKGPRLALAETAPLALTAAALRARAAAQVSA